jgi:hypothetical protein
VNRIDACFQRLRREGRTAFIPFLTDGDPDPQTTVALVEACARAGASIIELGFPYSDPVADGPTIQNSYSRTLSRGLHLDDVFGLVRLSRRRTDIPLAGMVSYSLVFRRGLARFASEAAQCGLDGLIVPDLPVEEAEPLGKAGREAGLATIYLVAPTTTQERRRRIAEEAESRGALPPEESPVPLRGVARVVNQFGHQPPALEARAKALLAADRLPDPGSLTAAVAAQQAIVTVEPEPTLIEIIAALQAKVAALENK